MTIRFSSLLLALFLSVTSVLAGAAGLQDANERLFQVQHAEAMKGEARAQYYLGEMYEQGIGTTQNIDEAFKWYEKAAKQGDELAKTKLGLRPQIEEELRQKKLMKER